MPLRNARQRSVGGTFSTVGSEPLAKQVRGVRLPISIDEWLQRHIGSEALTEWLRQAIITAVKAEAERRGQPIKSLDAAIEAIETCPAEVKQARLKWLQSLPLEVDLTSLDIFPDLFELTPPKATRLANVLVRQHGIIRRAQLAGMDDQALLRLYRIGQAGLCAIRKAVPYDAPPGSEPT